MPNCFLTYSIEAIQVTGRVNTIILVGVVTDDPAISASIKGKLNYLTGEAEC